MKWNTRKCPTTLMKETDFLMMGCESKKSADEMMALVKFICKTANEIEEVLNETTNAIAKFDVNLRWVGICINVSPVQSFSKLKIT